MYKLVMFLVVCVFLLTPMGVSGGGVEILVPALIETYDIFFKKEVKQEELPVETFFREVLMSKKKEVKKIKIEGAIAVGSQTAIFWGIAMIPKKNCFYFLYKEGGNSLPYALGHEKEDISEYKKFSEMSQPEQEKFLFMYFKKYMDIDILSY